MIVIARMETAEVMQLKVKAPNLGAFLVVEVTGFEPAAFWSRTKRATKLRYTSKLEPMAGFEPVTC